MDLISLNIFFATVKDPSNICPWYIAGPLIGLFVPFLLIVGNKVLGISSSFQHICSLLLKTKQFAASGYDGSSNRWKFFFAVGIVIGGLTARLFLGAGDTSFLPQQYYTISGLISLFAGGFLIGFGTRYANGCTAGHTIAGISTLQLSGWMATISFFIGGLIYTYYLFPFLN